MQTKPDVLAFLVEFIQRFGQKSPAFFNVLAWIGAIATFITGLPALLDEIGVSLPQNIENLESKVIMWCGIVIMIVSKLTVLRPPIQVTNSGDVINKTDSDKLPFTAKQEAKVLTDKTS